MSSFVGPGTITLEQAGVFDTHASMTYHPASEVGANSDYDLVYINFNRAREAEGGGRVTNDDLVGAYLNGDPRQREICAELLATRIAVDITKAEEFSAYIEDPIIPEERKFGYRESQRHILSRVEGSIEEVRNRLSDALSETEHPNHFRWSILLAFQIEADPSNRANLLRAVGLEVNRIVSKFVDGEASYAAVSHEENASELHYLQTVSRSLTEGDFSRDSVCALSAVELVGELLKFRRSNSFVCYQGLRSIHSTNELIDPRVAGLSASSFILHGKGGAPLDVQGRVLRELDHSIRAGDGPILEALSRSDCGKAVLCASFETAWRECPAFVNQRERNERISGSEMQVWQAFARAGVSNLEFLNCFMSAMTKWHDRYDQTWTSDSRRESAIVEALLACEPVAVANALLDAFSRSHEYAGFSPSWGRTDVWYPGPSYKAIIRVTGSGNLFSSTKDPRLFPVREAIIQRLEEEARHSARPLVRAWRILVGDITPSHLESGGKDRLPRLYHVVKTGRPYYY